MELIIRKHNRIDILDAIRGIAIISMVVYHGLYDVNDIFGFHLWIFDALSVLEPPFAGAFILLAGVSCRFSHSNLKRGLRVLVLALIVTVGTVLFSLFVSPGEEIYFGILHFMGAAILLYALLRRVLDKIPPAVSLPCYLLLFILTYSMPSAYQIGIPGLITVQLPSILARIPGLFILGLPGYNFMSADYFPLIPWFFLFLAGTVIGVPIREGKLPDWFYKARVPFFATAGRNTLLIYVLHQPVIYALLFFIFSLLQH